MGCGVPLQTENRVVTSTHCFGFEYANERSELRTHLCSTLTIASSVIKHPALLHVG